MILPYGRDRRIRAFPRWICGPMTDTKREHRWGRREKRVLISELICLKIERFQQPTFDPVTGLTVADDRRPPQNSMH